MAAAGATRYDHASLRREETPRLTEWFGQVLGGTEVLHAFVFLWKLDPPPDSGHRERVRPASAYMGTDCGKLNVFEDLMDNAPADRSRAVRGRRPEGLEKWCRIRALLNGLRRVK